MDDATPNVAAERTCPSAVVASMPDSSFAPVRGGTSTAFSFDASTQDIDVSPAPSPTKRLVVAVVKGIRGIAVVVFILCPFRSGALILTFVGSIIVFLICHWLLTTLDETYIDKHMKNGYWPTKPIDWTASASPDNQKHASNDK